VGHCARAVQETVPCSEPGQDPVDLTSVQLHVEPRHHMPTGGIQRPEPRMRVTDRRHQLRGNGNAPKNDAAGFLEGSNHGPIRVRPWFDGGGAGGSRRGATVCQCFDDSRIPEGIPTNILSDRLERLLAQGIVTQVSVAEGSKHMAYQLTDKGRALFPVLRAMRDWGLTWIDGTQAMSGRSQ